MSVDVVSLSLSLFIQKRTPLLCGFQGDCGVILIIDLGGPYG